MNALQILCVNATYLCIKQLFGCQNIKMPKVSEKAKFIQLCEKSLVFDLLMLELFGKHDEIQRKKEDEIMEDFSFALAAAAYFRYGSTFVHHSVPKSPNFLIDVLPHLDENRFREIVRVSKTTFDFIIDLIKDDEVFNGPRSCKQFPIQIQLAVVMYRLGSCGEGATITKIASLFGISDGGVIQVMTNRVFDAIIKRKTQFLFWPDPVERRALVVQTLSELPHCVGYVDGTEIKLAEKPTVDCEAYFSRKHIYSLKAQCVCDHKLVIRHMVLGYPGSVHDARIYNNCELSTNATEMLTGSEWLAADSAYKLTSTLITPFRINATEGTLNQRILFNRTFSQYRIRIEHCFGLLKERFNSLKELKIQIKSDNSVKFACRWILVCAILHNIILKKTTVVLMLTKKALVKTVKSTSLGIKTYQQLKVHLSAFHCYH
ncbi:putative nuclease HARBI1 [Zeugodacus cucurbitae]|uniref:putative nuclease HARBI1 n=1 Tax=Zeugodacus cucurbitae TaxID=28588 RepID=UPI0023D947A5|nr:putative nuclease HARBI1 [Zeugodacus cucurbitae]